MFVKVIHLMVAEAIRERYLRDPLPRRLGNLAMDLEGKFFAEWAAAEAPPETQAILAEVQGQLALWQRRWTAGRSEPRIRMEAQRWSDQILALSGLMG